jgi:branched-chain amino acid transport system permease protein
VVSTIFSGMILGSVYTLAAIGLSLQWGVLKNLNFSHGACITLGAYIMWAGFGAKLTYLPAFLVVMVVMFFIGMAIEWTTIRPFFGKEDVEVDIFIATVALSSIIAQIILLVFGGKDKDLDVAFQGITDFGIFTTTNHKLFILIIAPIILFAMWLVLNKTSIGRAIRAVSQDPMGAILIGINTRRIYGITLGAATVLAGISGILLGPIYFLNPHMGETPMTKAFIIVILGGIGSLKGTLVAAFIVALIEVLVGLFVGVTWGPIGIFLVMIAILIVKPEGLFGVSLRTS